MGAIRIAAAAALAMGMGAMLTGTALAAEASSKPDKNDPSRRICRNITPSGSRLTTRICRTQAEWDASMAKTQDGVLKSQMTESTQLQPAPRPN